MPPANTKASSIRALGHDDSGTDTLEFALTALLLFLVMLGIMECSRAVYIEHFIHSAAQDATRYAMVRGSSWSGVGCATSATLDCDATSANISSYVQSITPPGVVSSSIVTTATWTGLSAAGTVCDTSDGNNSPGCIVHVQITYPFKLILPFPGRTTIQLNSNATVTIAQ